MVTITAKGSQYEFAIGYGGFFDLRRNIAMALDEDFGRHYSTLTSCFTTNQFEDYNFVTELLVRQKALRQTHGDVLDFLYLSDCNGEAEPQTCKHILELIQDTKFEGRCFARQSCADSEEEGWATFKKFLADCCANNRKMVWY